MRSHSSSYGRLTTLALSAGAAMLYAGAIAAQTADATATPGAAKEQGSLQEIVVTAQRRSESVQDVPIAIAALTGDQLARAGITDVQGLTVATPGLHISNASGEGLVFLRGVGAVNTFAGSEGSVAVYVDNVYYGDPAGVLTSLANVERVEVLKGPQGTLYGRNATGGLINIITPDPQSAPQMKASLAYESYRTVIGSVYATGGTEQLKGSLFVEVRHQGQGWGRNLAVNEDTNFSEYQNFRGKLLWEPGAADRVTLSAGYFRNPSDYGRILQIAPGTTTIVGGTYVGRPWDTAQTPPNRDQLTETKDLALHWDHKFDNGMTFKSVSAYRHIRWDDVIDLDGIALPILFSVQNKNVRSLQQEFLVQGNANVLSRQLDYTGGVFYYNSKTSPNNFNAATAFPVAATIVDQTEFSTNESYAAYGQADYQFTNRDTLTAGIRYTLDKVKFREIALAGAGYITVQPPPATFREPTWRLALKHQITDQWMAYASYSRGYKSGLYDNSGIASDGTVNLVKPEILNAYEVGSKATLWNGKLQLGINGFYYDYKDIQVIAFSGLDVLLRNAATAKIYGSELEAALAVPVPVGDLQMRATYGLLSNKYGTFPGCTINAPQPFPPGGNDSLTGDCSGNHLIYAPEQQISVGLTYAVPVASGKLEMGTTIFHSTGFFLTADDLNEASAYYDISADVAYTFPDGRTRLRVYGKNLTNKAELQYANAAAPLTGVWYSPPRVGGVEVQYTLE